MRNTKVKAIKWIFGATIGSAYHGMGLVMQGDGQVVDGVAARGGGGTGGGGQGGGLGEK